MPAQLACFEEACRARFPITEVLYNCPRCGGLIESVYDWPQSTSGWKKMWRERRMSNAPIDQSGVWRYREFLPFLEDYSPGVTLREGSTPLLDSPRAAENGGGDPITVKPLGVNPTGSLKKKRQRWGAARARR